MEPGAWGNIDWEEPLMKKFLLSALVLGALMVSAAAEQYAAIWDKSGGPAWQARHGLSGAQYQQTFNNLVNQGYRLVHVDGCTISGEARYAAIWDKSGGPAWQARHGLPGAQYQQTFNNLVNQGYRLVDVDGY
jgi:hypothetical protein